MGSEPEASDETAHGTPSKRPSRRYRKQDEEIAQLEDEARRLREVLRNARGQKSRSPSQ